MCYLKQLPHTRSRVGNMFKDLKASRKVTLLLRLKIEVEPEYALRRPEVNYEYCLDNGVHTRSSSTILIAQPTFLSLQSLPTDKFPQSCGVYCIAQVFFNVVTSHPHLRLIVTVIHHQPVYTPLNFCRFCINCSLFKYLSVTVGQDDGHTRGHCFYDRATKSLHPIMMRVINKDIPR